MTNIGLSKKIIECLLDTGVREFILCAGARNSPLVYLLESLSQIKVYHFFEERSASFFALGRIAESRAPVAVITTSGTAVAEILPATVEANYSSLPLIILTADRPKSYRGSGAPQSIQQVGLFSYYIEACFDLDKENTHISLKSMSWKKPIHINVCFDEPLIDDTIPSIDTSVRGKRIKFPQQQPIKLLNQVQDFIRSHRPMIVVSTLPAAAKDTVFNFLKNFNGPMYIESVSGLQNHPELRFKSIKSGEKMASQVFKDKLCDSIIRIGGIPTLRLWRDLEHELKEIPVLSLGYNHFTGLSRVSLHFTYMEVLADSHLFDLKTKSDLEGYAQLFQQDLLKNQRLNELIQNHPCSEVAWIRHLSLRTHLQNVYLGNSLPIREWDLAADPSVFPSAIAANRGANGIDGQVSTFLGWSHDQKENWAFVGDLTALYDLVALWVTDQLSERLLRIVIINNGGGQIFKRVFQKDIFLNTHSLKFKAWAQMWGWSYLAVQSPEDLHQAKLEKWQIIEVLPNAEQSQKFWDQWDQEWI